MKAIIQAGGRGTRLQPYTLVLPKPMMPVGEYPVIEILIKWLRRNDIDNVTITTGYLGHLLQAFCGNGEKWDMEITYTIEPEPLGTVGSLALVPDEIDDTFLVLNGDLLTDLDLQEFLVGHKKSKAILSIATTDKKLPVDLGVLEVDSSSFVNKFKEKPEYSFDVSMGVYLMEPEILRLIPRGVPFGFDDLVLCLLRKEMPIWSYKHKGIWMDIGRTADYEEANEQFPKIERLVLGT